MERGCGRTLSRASCDALLRVRRDLFLGPARTCEPAPGRAAGSWARDMSRLPCFPRALGRCLFRRCCLWLEASNCFLSACGELPGPVARAPTRRSEKVVLDQSPSLSGPPRAHGNKGAHRTQRVLQWKARNCFANSRNFADTIFCAGCGPVARRTVPSRHRSI